MNHLCTVRWVLATILLLVCVNRDTLAQTAPNAPLLRSDSVSAALGDSSDSASASDSPTIFPHSNRSRYLLAGQANIIFQADPPFHSPYEGTNSFIGRGEYKTSMVGTLYMGYQLFNAPSHSTEFFLDTEEAAGRGLSEALGIAGFTNLDVVRNPNLGKTPYLARYSVHQTIGLGGKTVEAERGVFPH